MSDWATASGARGPSSLQSRPSCAPAQGRRGRAAADRAARARQLTAALLEADFGVRGWWVPDLWPNLWPRGGQRTQSNAGLLPHGNGHLTRWRARLCSAQHDGQGGGHEARQEQARAQRG
jgi:hypothetical protein